MHPSVFWLRLYFLVGNLCYNYCGWWFQLAAGQKLSLLELVILRMLTLGIGLCIVALGVLSLL